MDGDFVVRNLAPRKSASNQNPITILRGWSVIIGDEHFRNEPSIFGIEENEYGTYRGHHTSEGYRIYEHGDKSEGYTAIDEFGDPIYSGNMFDIDDHPFDLD